MFNFRSKGTDRTQSGGLAGHPILEKFPAGAERISELIENDQEFAGICRDYADIVGEISEIELEGSSALLLDHLIRLRSDLEADIAAKLGAGYKT